jgi:hypothetical protein
MGYDSDEDLDEDIVAELASQIVSVRIEDDLPEGWEKQIDPNNGIPYYVNTITQSSQWSRPSSPAGNLHEEDHPEVVKVIDDERKLFDSLSLMSHDGISSQDEHLSSRKRVPLEATDRIESFISISENDNEKETAEEEQETKSPPAASSSETTALDLKEIQPVMTPTPVAPIAAAVAAVVEEEDEPEIPCRKGILQKQGGLFGMWSKKFFLLENEILSYYENSQAYLSGARPSKQMQLTGSTELSYTKMSHCFKVKTDNLEFILMSENKDLMKEWITDIRTIVTVRYDARIKGVMMGAKKK